MFTIIENIYRLYKKIRKSKKKKRKKKRKKPTKCSFENGIISYEMIFCFLKGEYFYDVVCYITFCRVHRK